MSALVTPFDPQPGAGDLPERLPSPFDPGPPHPLARRAAERVMAALRGGAPLPPEAFAEPHRGKMFGVLVVVDGGGRVGYLRGFSGMLGGTWEVEGFVGPLFDPADRDAVWLPGEAELLAFDARLGALDGEAATLHAALAGLAAAQAEEAAALASVLAEQRRLRRDERARVASAALDEGARRAALHALDQASRADEAARRRLRDTQQGARGALAAALAANDEARAALKARRFARSSELLELIFAGYEIPNGRGARRGLRAIFGPESPPGGAGDCAAPKLFGHALRAGLRPIALAEFWWGTPPATGGRLPGRYYPSCRGKCGPILAHMLDGLDVDPIPIFGGGRIPADEPRTVFEDDWIVVVDKPVGLLSVPGRSGLLRDSVLTRLARRHPDATGPIVVHRLDLDTSGLLLAAKDPRTHAALQRQFARREVDKRYVAWLDGRVEGDRGVVELALRVDLDDRPRQIHDPVHGKAAVTEWRVLSRAAGRTLVALVPRTGRTHQLRVHAAHPQGLGAPIVGDRLYGEGGERLLLHAEALAFRHPHTGARVELVREAPFARARASLAP